MLLLVEQQKSVKRVEEALQTVNPDILLDLRHLNENKQVCSVLGEMSGLSE